MSTNKTRGAKNIDSYFALMKQHPLKAIRSSAEYEAASAVLTKLVLRGDLDSGEAQYLDVLEMLIEAYDDKHDPVAPDRRPPLARLKALIQSSGTTPAKLQTILGASQSMVSMILNGQRELSKKPLAKLSRYYKVDAAYFL